MKAGIYGNRYQDSYLGELREFIASLRRDGISVCVYDRFASYLGEHSVALDEGEICGDFPADADMVVSIGGDGTLLRAAEWVAPREVPVMGINTGHLGYLAGFSFACRERIMQALAGVCEQSSRMKLELKSEHLPAGECPYAVNEISVSKGDTTSMVDIRAWVDGSYLADYLADGLVVSTPTGSTAYNLSCGGPILQPTLDCITLTPIAPHSLTLRPLVISGGAELLLEVRSRGVECHVGIDGRTFSIPSSGAMLRVVAAGHRLVVAQPPGTDFPSVLRGKLGWGQRN